MFRLLIILPILIPIIAFSQSNNEFQDTIYFESMREKLNLAVGLDSDVESFEYNDEDSNFSVKPNTSLRLVFSVNHKFLNLKIGFTPKFLQSSDSDKKGETKVFKIGLYAFTNNWIQNFEYSNIKGYYKVDITENGPLENEMYIIYPNLHTKTFRGVTSFKINKKFSYKALHNRSEIQRISAGSFIPGLTYEYFKISGESSLPEVQSINLILNAAYYYTFVVKKNWHFNLSLEPGVGIGFNKLINNEPNQNWSNGLILDVKSYAGLGYNSTSYFSGILYKAIATITDEKSAVKFGSVRGSFNIYFGYRFKSPKFMDKTFDWIEGKNK